MAIADHIWTNYNQQHRPMQWRRKVMEDSHERPLFGKLAHRRVIVID